MTPKRATADQGRSLDDGDRPYGRDERLRSRRGYLHPAGVQKRILRANSLPGRKCKGISVYTTPAPKIGRKDEFRSSPFRPRFLAEFSSSASHSPRLTGGPVLSEKSAASGTNIYSAKNIPDKVQSSKMDPEIKEWLKTGPVLGSHKPIYVQRREHDAFIDKVKIPIGKIEELALEGPHGTIPIRVYHPIRPGMAAGGALVYLHGGGFIVGSLDQFDTAMRRLANGSGAQVYAVDYKLAPEYQWPVQIDENEFVVRWLFENSSQRHVDARRIALGGDSAGGNMTCVISQKLRNEHGPKLALQMPLYPEAMMPFFTPAGVENISGGYVDTAGVLLFVWSLLPQGTDYSQPYVTPMNASDFSGLPRALLVTCGFDMLRDVGHMYAKKLAAAGNDITYVHYPDLPHGIIQMTMHSKRCLEATEEIARLLGQGLKAA